MASSRTAPSPLVSQSVNPLDWSGSLINYKNMTHIHIIRDGSCFFHAVANAMHVPYKLGRIDGRPLNRKEFIRGLRKDLADKLSSPIDPDDPESELYYDIISRGQLRDFSEEEGSYTQRYSLENMKRELDSSSPVDFIYNELVSDLLDIDIYLLDYDKRDVYVIGDDLDLFYKDRNSVVLLYMHSESHYDLVGINNGGTIETLFSFDHPFITYIRERLIEVIRLGAR